MTGTWKATWKIVGGADYETTGALVAYPAPVESFAKDQNWTQFQGTTGGYSTPAPAGSLLDDIFQARPVWKSEVDLGAANSNGPDFRYIHKVVLVGPGHGSSSPVIHNGVVYMLHYVPNRQAPFAGEKTSAFTTALSSKKEKPTPQVESFLKNPSEASFRANAGGRFPSEVEQDMLLDCFRTNANDVLVAMDANTGATLWRMTVPGRAPNIQTHKTRGINPSPVIVEGPGTGELSLVTHSYAGTLYVVDAKTGKLRWRQDDGQPRTRIGQHDPFGFFEASPVVAESGQGMVVVRTERGKAGLVLVGRELATGTTKWTSAEFSFRNPRMSQPMNGPLHYWKAPSGPAVIKTSAVTGQAVAVDLATGKLLWGPVDAFPDQINFDSPFMVGDWMLGFTRATAEGVTKEAATKDGDKKDDQGKSETKDENETGGTGTLRALRVTADGLKPEWTLPSFKYYQCPRMTVLDGILTITGDGTLSQVELATGKVLAQPPLQAKAGNNAMRCGDRVLALSDGAHGRTEYEWYAIDPSGKNTKRLNDKFWVPPHCADGSYHGTLISWPIVDGRLFVRGGGGLYCYDLRKPPSAPVK